MMDGNNFTLLKMNVRYSRVPFPVVQNICAKINARNIASKYHLRLIEMIVAKRANKMK